MAHEFFDPEIETRKTLLLNKQSTIFSLAKLRLSHQETNQALTQLFGPEQGQPPSGDTVDQRWAKFSQDFQTQDHSAIPSAIQLEPVDRQEILDHLVVLVRHYRATGDLSLVNGLLRGNQKRLDIIQADINGVFQELTSEADRLKQVALLHGKLESSAPLSQEETKLLDQRLTTDTQNFRDTLVDRLADLRYQPDATLSVLPTHSPHLSVHWPPNTQVLTSGNQENPTAFRHHIPNLVSEMAQSPSLSDAAAATVQNHGYLLPNGTQVLPGFKAVTPLLSNPSNPPLPMWQRNDPTVRRRVLVQIVGENEDPRAQYEQDAWDQRDRSDLEAAVHHHYDLPDRPVEVITLKGKSKGEIQAELARLSQEANGETEFLFHISAHGSTQENRRLNALRMGRMADRGPLPTPGDPQGLHVGQAWLQGSENINENEFKSWIQGFSNARGVFVIVDTCFSGAWVA
jgi:hypothetical protein